MYEGLYNKVLSPCFFQVDRMAMFTCYDTVRAALGRLSALSVFLCESVLYGAFVWARRALNGRKRRFPARADHAEQHMKDSDVRKGKIHRVDPKFAS